MTGGPRTEWELVGRQRELGEVTQLLRSPSLSGVVLMGSGGVGKTRLANECVALAESRGAPVVRAMATRAASGIALAALAPILPESAAVGDALARARAALRDRAGADRLVLFADDAHLLDAASAALIRQLMSDGELFLLATVRTPTDVPPEIELLWDDRRVERLELGPLGETHVDHLIGASLGGVVSGLTALELRRLCRGNPLTLRELILSLDESGNLAGDHHGRYELRGPLRVSDRLADLVESRLSALGVDESSVVEYVALGEPIEVALLEQLAGPDAIESCRRKGIIVLRGDEDRLEAWLDHPLFGEVLRANVGTIRTRNVLRSMADAMEARGVDRPGDLIRLAVWRLESGSRADEQLLLAAAQEAWARQSYDLANRICSEVWESNRTFETGHVLASSLGDLGRFDEADEILDQVAAMDDSEDVQGSVVVVRSEHRFRAGQADEAVAAVRAARSDVTSARWASILDAHLSTLLLLRGEVGEASTLAEAAYGSDSTEAVNAAALVIGTALTWDGRPLDGLAIHEHAFETCRDAAQVENASLALLNNVNIQVVGMIQALTQAGRLADADELLGAAWQQASADNAPVPMAWISLMYSLHRSASGLIGEALQWADVSTDLLRSSGVAVRMRWSQGVAAASLAILGRGDQAMAVLRDIDRDQPVVRFNEAYLDDARAWVLASTGDYASARATCASAVAKGIEMGQRTGAAIALHSLARLGAPTQAAKMLGELRDHLQGALHEARVEHIDALAVNSAERLSAVSQRFEVIGAQLLAAEASADAARAYRDSKRSSKASSELKRTGVLVERCQGARTPALSSVGAASLLTRREWEVASLAARGRRSKQIAERLGLSMRTVENHLSHTFQKLGVSTRDDLADLPELAG